MRIDWTVKFGDLLTSITIALSATALVFSMWIDRREERESRADEVRAAASVGLTQIDRWQLLAASLYRQLQPEFIEVSELLADSSNAERARDRIWREVLDNRARLHDRILDEKIYTAYVGLLAHYPAMREEFSGVIDELRQAEQSIFESFILKVQDDILQFADAGPVGSASVGNVLRESALVHEASLERRTAEVTASIRSRLFEIIGSDDGAILRVERNSAG